MIEEIRAKHGAEATKNWSFDHCTFMNPTDIPRAAKLGLMFSCAPKYILGAAEIADSYGEQMANSYVVPVKSMIDSGATVAYESGTGSYIWEDLELLVTRKDKDGKVWGPQERIDRMVALRMATQWAADYVLRGDQLGSLEPGKLADIVTIDRDYRAIPPEQLSDVQVVMTISDGRVVYVHDDLAAEASLRPAGAVISTYKKLTARRPGAVRSGEGLR
jgi:predicted amidohydrolase YtcJ